jgi:hypothetical protein
MSGDWLAEDAYKMFCHKQHELETGGDLNEATTRLRVIDTILFDVLKWDKLSVETEKHSRAGYLDYIFGRSPAYSLVLEAKREGVEFVLPSHKYPADAVPFALIARECLPAADALRQAHSYANQFGARYSAITNGHQWLMSLTFVPNHAVEDRLVFVFESLEAINKRFRAFFECFTATAINANLPSMRLLDERRAPAPPKLSASIVGYPIAAERNTLINTLRPVLQLVWDEMNFDADNEVFLQHCYIAPEPSQDMLRVARELLEQRRATDDMVALAVEHADPKKVLAMRERSEKERPVVVLGRIGHGKSTFLKYLRHIAAKDILKSKYIQIDIDFLDRPATVEDVPTYILDEVDRQLKDNYGIRVYDDDLVRHALRQELKEFHSSPRGKLLAERQQELREAEVEFMESFTKDRNKYLVRLMRHLRHGHNKSIAIYFDNLDRRDDSIQEQAFLRASAIAAEWSALVFVCLRPGTVQRSQARGTLDAIAQRVVVVSAPKTAPMLRKRFQYAAKFARRALPPESYARAAFSDTVQSSLPQSATFFDMCDSSIHRNAELAHQYEAVANGNIRLVMKYVRDVLTSNHLDTHKIIDILQTTGEYDLAEHETLRAMIYGPHVHYEANSSPFVNVYEIRRVDPTEHFSRLLLLDYCHRHANSVDRYGFIPLTAIHTYMGNLGFSVDHIHDVIDVLFAKKCIEGRDYDEESPELGDEVRITSLGTYHVTALARRFVYLDAMVMDTPILDEKTRGRVKDVQALQDRLERAREFLRYLDHCAQSITDVEARRVWNDMSTALVNDITDAENDAAARAARGR